MSNAILEKEIETLPQSAIDEVVDFIRTLKIKLSNNENSAPKKSYFGIWKNDTFFMSDDFNESLPEFAEYM